MCVLEFIILVICCVYKSNKQNSNVSKMKKVTLSFVFFWVLSCSFNVYSETIWEDFSRWSIGIGLGANVFDGDIQITENQAYNFPSIEGYVEYGLTPVLGAGLGYNFHSIKAGNTGYQFTSKMHYIYPFVSINFVNLFLRENQSKWHIGMTVGAGLANYTSDKEKNTGTTANPDFTEYASLKNQKAFVIPVSALIEYDITKRIAVNARYQYAGFNRDDVEGGGPKLEDRYKGVTNDYLANFSVGLRWKFVGKKQHTRNVDMATYLPMCCYKPEPREEVVCTDYQPQLDSLLKRIEELEKRPEPVVVVEEPKKEPEVIFIPPVKDKEVVVVFQRTMWGINFETDKDIIKPESYPILDNVVKLMEENPRYQLTIKGHTDDVGKPEYNLDLSKRRARSVKIYMVQNGIAADRITTEGYGDTDPIANNNTAYGRSRNRRVDFLVTYEDVKMESNHGEGDLKEKEEEDSKIE